MTALDRAAKVAGSLAKLGALIGVSPSTPGNWKHEGRLIPPEYCAAIERVTKGKVSRQDLRPDDWAAIWPELAKRKRVARITGKPAEEQAEATQA